MKKLSALLLICSAATAFAQTDEDQAKQVILSAYIGGIHNGGPVEDIRKGFHPTFNMLRLMDNQVKPLPLEEWIANIEKSRSEQKTTGAKAEGKFVAVTVSGNSANVVLEIYHADKKIFTDNLLLYKFTEGWRIVSKTYYRWP